MSIITDISKILYSIAIILLTLITFIATIYLLYYMALTFGSIFYFLLGIIFIYLGIE
jgi:hypothetical protein